jgi:hypothetical protein
MNFTEALLNPVFAVLQVPAVLTTDDTAAPFDIMVIDKTDGLPTEGNEIGIQTIRPACAVKVADLLALNIDIVELDGGIIVFNDRTWRIESHSRAPTPGGEDDGQLYMWLIKGD